MDINAIYTGIITGVVALGGSIAHNHSMFKRTGSRLIEEVKAAVKVGSVVVKDVESVAKSPLVKAAETELAHKLTADFRKSEIGRLAGAALHGAQKALDAISPEEKQAIVAWVVKESPKAWNVTTREVEDAIAQAQKDADALASWDVFAFSAKLAEAKKAAEQPAKEEAPATA